MKIDWTIPRYLMTSISSRYPEGFEAEYTMIEPDQRGVPDRSQWIKRDFPDRLSAVSWLRGAAAELSVKMRPEYGDDGEVDYEHQKRERDRTIENFQRGIADLLARSQSQAVLYWSFDAELKRILLDRMADSKKVHDRLFKGYAPLNTFAAKVDLCFALRAFDEATYKDLRIIKDVRNLFAHPDGVPTFEVKQIRDLCRGLATFAPDTTDYAELFFASATTVLSTLQGIQLEGLSS